VAAIRPLAGPGAVTSFEIEAEAGRDVRGDLARAVVQRGFDLLGLQQAGMSLEEIFLHLTTTEPAETAPTEPAIPPEVTA
jgi:hypothetical protein